MLLAVLFSLMTVLTNDQTFEFSSLMDGLKFFLEIPITLIGLGRSLSYSRSDFARLLITAVILRITVKYCFWLVRDSNHPFLFLSNCIQNPLGLCSVSVWSYVESYLGIISSITVQNKGILEESQES